MMMPAPEEYDPKNTFPAAHMIAVGSIRALSRTQRTVHFSAFIEKCVVCCPLNAHPVRRAR